ncbi:hypothetical protein PhCBS80983_g02559 [Powellomyces hirtus]|uniref:Uncharacterized protein n=1 Tax=Powellomyces hirtus TaxID=109895 RepID=A0A507E5I6_9FUNG|nr:hypothetical protein PhCBS80983_g02559 [Powellomyces hirtus]
MRCFSLNNCERPENTNTREAYFVREWDSIFRTLTPPCVVLSPPEEAVAASKQRKLQQAEPDATHVHGRKADLLWQTCSGLSLVWGEAKKGSWAANPKEADQAKLKVVKGVKDMIDHVQRHKLVVVPLWASVNLATSWTLRKAAKLDTGVVLIGDICRYDLPREFMQFPVLIDMCKTLLIWGQVMTMTTRKIGLAGRLHGGSRTPPRLPVMVRTFQTPNTKDTAKEPPSKKCKRSEESEST